VVSEQINRADLLATIKPSVRNMSGYSLKRRDSRIKINQNENPWDVPGEIREETLRRVALKRWSRYPDFDGADLRQRLADFAGWEPEGILVGNGSNELIQALMMVTVGRGTRVLINEPTFTLYRQLATTLEGEVVSVPLTGELQYDSQALIQAVRKNLPAVTIICSPNNPTGCVLELRDLSALLEMTSGLVVIDEAYVEFGGESAVALLRRYPNLVLLRTFSKAMALAGLRVGYLLTSPELAKEISKAILPYNLNIFSRTAAEVALEVFANCLKSLVETICAERDRLYLGLKSVPGLSPFQSHANFILVKTSIPPSRIFESLLRREILIRDVSSYPMLAECFRVSVGTPAENDELLVALKEICAEAFRKESSK
jgi:histidinol-phosphate aminotransferase